jgi:hypothetical protein
VCLVISLKIRLSPDLGLTVDYGVSRVSTSTAGRRKLCRSFQIVFAHPPGIPMAARFHRPHWSDNALGYSPPTCWDGAEHSAAHPGANYCDTHVFISDCFFPSQLHDRSIGSTASISSTHARTSSGSFRFPTRRSTASRQSAVLICRLLGVWCCCTRYWTHYFGSTVGRSIRLSVSSAHGHLSPATSAGISITSSSW